jgi:hypothetical protein
MSLKEADTTCGDILKNDDETPVSSSHLEKGGY